MTSGIRLRIALAMALLCPLTALSQSVSVDDSARWEVNGASIDFGCAHIGNAGTIDVGGGELGGIGNLVNGGVFTVGNGALEVGGDWVNHGTFSAGTGVVMFSDHCDAPQATIQGDTAFATLDIASSRGKRYRLNAGDTQSVATALRLNGSPGSHLVLRSTQSGSQSRIALATGGVQQVGWIDVADQAAPAGSQWLALGAPATFNSINSGNNFRWFGTPAVARPVPATSSWLLTLLVGLMVVIGMARFRTR